MSETQRPPAACRHLTAPFAELSSTRFAARVGEDQPTMHPSFLEAYREGGLEGIRLGFWATLDAAGAPTALAAYALATVHLDCLASPWIQRLAGRIRRLWPGFLQIRVLFFGPPASLGTFDVVEMDELDEGERDAVRRALVETSVAMLHRERATALVWKEFDRIQRADWEPALRARDLALHPSVPTVKQALPFGDLEEYEAALRSSYRRQLRKNRRAARCAGLVIRTGEPFAEHVESWYPLFLEVLEHSETRLETLTLDFFRELARDREYLLNTAHQDGRLAGGALCRQHGDTLVFVFVGMDYARAREGDLYFNLLHSVLALALQRGCRRISWGQTSFDAKGRFGGRLVPLWFAMRFRNRLLGRVVGLLAPLLFPEREQLSRRVFKADPEAD